jgi:hypothetical protein
VTKEMSPSVRRVQIRARKSAHHDIDIKGPHPAPERRPAHTIPAADQVA